MANRNLASRIHVRDAAEADKTEPTRMTQTGHSLLGRTRLAL